MTTIAAVNTVTTRQGEQEQMPKITLSVKKADQAIWSRAKKLASSDFASLSSLVTAAVDSLVVKHDEEVEKQKLRGKEMERFDLALGQGHRLRFTGLLLADWDSDPAESGRDDLLAIYQTKGGKIVYYTHRDEEDYPSHREFPDFDTLRKSSKVPDALIGEAAAKLGKVIVVEID